MILLISLLTGKSNDDANSQGWNNHLSASLHRIHGIGKGDVIEECFSRYYSVRGQEEDMQDGKMRERILHPLSFTSFNSPCFIYPNTVIYTSCGHNTLRDTGCVADVSSNLMPPS
jgi:hypothetical protein